MRLFSEQDVVTLLTGESATEMGLTPEELIAMEVETGKITPFEIEMPGGTEQARAFAEWMRTGEIPAWRKKQIEDDAVRAAFHERGMN